MSVAVGSSMSHDKLLEEIKNTPAIKKLNIVKNIVRELIKHLLKPIEVGDNVVLCKSDFVVASAGSESIGKSEAVFKVVESDKTWLPSNARLNYYAMLWSWHTLILRLAKWRKPLSFLTEAITRFSSL